VIVVESVDQRRLLDDFVAAVGAGSACAVVDPTWPDAARSAAHGALDAAVSRDDLHDGDLVLFTSGSTGRPRGVVRTVESWRASLDPLTGVVGLTAEDVVSLPGPLWSSLFLYGAWHAESVGARTILRGEDPASATVVHCVPAHLPGVRERVVADRLPSLRTVVVAGDRTPSHAFGEFRRVGVRLVEYYGAAELSFVGWRDGTAPLHAFPGVEFDLRAGVLWARSPYLARGYLSPDRPGPLLWDDEGWATVGDLAVSHGSGFEVLGRGDAAVTTGGHTVVVEDVERWLQALPGVTDAAALGVPDPRLGQVLVAVVVGDAPTGDLRSASRLLPSASRPRRWLRVDALPRTSAGKLRRSQLLDHVVRELA
jgi:long-chain acyl-CoA synthetase